MEKIIEFDGVKLKAEEVTIYVPLGSNLKRIWTRQATAALHNAAGAVIAKKNHEAEEEAEQKKYAEMYAAGFDIRKERVLSSTEKDEITDILWKIYRLKRAAGVIRNERIKALHEKYYLEQLQIDNDTSIPDYKRRMKKYESMSAERHAVDALKAEAKRMEADAKKLDAKIEKIKSSAKGWKYVPHQLMNGDIPLRDEKIAELMGSSYHES